MVAVGSVMNSLTTVGRLAAAGAGVVGVAHLINNGIVKFESDDKRITSDKKVEDKAATDAAFKAKQDAKIASQPEADKKDSAKVKEAIKDIKREDSKVEKFGKTIAGSVIDALGPVRPKVGFGLVKASLVALAAIAAHQGISFAGGRSACLVDLGRCAVTRISGMIGR